MKNNKGFGLIAILISIVAVLAVGGFLYYKNQSLNPSLQNIPVSQNNTPTPISTSVNTLALTSKDNGKTFIVAKEQMVTVTLCNPGDGGYQFDTPQYNSSILSLTSHINVPLNPPNPPDYVGGCYGNDVFKFQVLNTGSSKLVITASRGTTGTINMFSATIVAQNAQEGIKPNACIPNWQCGWGQCIIPPCAPGSNSVACTKGTQTQIAIDSNNCGLSSSNINIACPALARVCN